MKIAAVLLSVFATSVAAQDLTVQFADHGQSDRLSFHTAGCDISDAIVLIDLGGSQGGLNFHASDTATDTPVEITHGYGALSTVKNGDKRLQLLVHSLVPGDTLDVAANLAVSPSELAGASIRLALSDRVLSGTFDSAGTAKIDLPSDASVCLASAN